MLQRRMLSRPGDCSRLLFAAVLIAIGTGFVSAQDEAQEKRREAAPLGRFLTIGSPVDDTVYARVTNAALALQNQAQQEKRRAILVLEITPGSSQFHHVQGLARFLTSAQLSQVTTVAWIPETVTGNNAVLALAANEIVMHPSAELGDIGRGQALEADEQHAVLLLVQKRHNAKVNEALAAGMVDPQKRVWKIQVKPAGDDDQPAESRIVTDEELRELQKSRLAILDTVTIKEAGVPGLFSGTTARDLDVLAVQTAESRSAVAELYRLPREAMREDATAGRTVKARLIRVDDMIEPVLETFVERQIDRAVAGGANLLIFEIDSPGGFLLSSTNLAYKISDLDPKRVRTVAYVPRKAHSGAAIIALGADEIYMHPEAQIGDAGPIEIAAGQQFERAPEKVVSTLRLTLKTLAERKGRPAAIAQAMADKDLQVYRVTHRDTGRVWYMSEDEIHASDGEWNKGRVVPESATDLLLTVDGQRAYELKLAEAPIRDTERPLDELKQRLGIPASFALTAVGRTWVDTLIFVLNTPGATFLLLVLGVVCIYLELHFTSGLLGIISTVCFGLFFWSRFLGGTAGWLEVVLFVIGLACLALEVFVLPGFGVFGVSGILLLISSLVLASQTFGNIEPNADFSFLTRTIGTLTATLVAVIVLAVFIGRYLPHVPVFNQMVLAPPGAPAYAPGEPRLRDSAPGPTSSHYPNQPLIGDRGETLSMLRPAGKARVGDRVLDVVSEGPYISSGSQVEIVSVSGNRIVVREA